MKILLSAFLLSCLMLRASFALEFRIDSVTAAPASQVIIPVRVAGFDNIIGMQGSIQFDVNVISYSGVQQFGLPGMTTSSIGINQVANGKLTYLWDDQTLEGQTLADNSVIFEIVFNVVGTNGQQSSLCFADAPTPREVIDSNFNSLTGTYVCGNLQIPGGSIPVANISKTDITCSGANDGTATVSASGGTSPYTYSWSNGGSTPTISGLSAGTYTVTVTDAGYATASGSVTVNEPASLSATATATDVSGCGLTDGSATVSVTGGTPTYSYSWSNGETTVTINNLAGGSYDVTVTDGNGCNVTDNVTVGQPSGISAVISASQPVSCFGGNDGSATANSSGGLSPYTYSWSNGATTAMVTGLSAGMVSVTVEDANNCQAVNSVTITQPNQLVATASADDAACNGTNSGSATVTLSGGTPTYSYSWSNGVTTADNFSLVAGNYAVTVTDDNGCIATSSAVVNEPDAISSTLSVTNASAFGAADGAIDLEVTGGTPPYSYVWSNGSTDEDINGLAAGIYAVAISDANSCAVADSATVEQPVSAGKLGWAEGIKIFPNPNNGSFEVNVIAGSNSFTRLEILNALGQVVYALPLNASVLSDNKISVSASLEKGVYVTRLSDESRIAVARILMVE